MWSPPTFPPVRSRVKTCFMPESRSGIDMATCSDSSSQAAKYLWGKPGGLPKPKPSTMSCACSFPRLSQNFIDRDLTSTTGAVSPRNTRMRYVKSMPSATGIDIRSSSQASSITPRTGNATKTAVYPGDMVDLLIKGWGGTKARLEVSQFRAFVATANSGWGMQGQEKVEENTRRMATAAVGQGLERWK